MPETRFVNLTHLSISGPLKESSEAAQTDETGGTRRRGVASCCRVGRGIALAESANRGRMEGGSMKNTHQRVRAAARERMSANRGHVEPRRGEAHERPDSRERRQAEKTRLWSCGVESAHRLGRLRVSRGRGLSYSLPLCRVRLTGRRSSSAMDIWRASRGSAGRHNVHCVVGSVGRYSVPPVWSLVHVGNRVCLYVLESIGSRRIANLASVPSNRARS